MPQAQRAYQPQEDRPNRSASRGWGQMVNNSLNMLDEEYDEPTSSIARPVAPAPRPLRPNQSGPLRTAPVVAPTRAPGQSLMSRLSRSSETLGQAKPLAFIALGAVALLVAYLAVSTAAAFVGNKLDDMSYGETRTTHTEAYVGHGETDGNPTHFTAINLHGQIVVVEFPGGDASKAMVITGPYLFGAGEDKTPVNLKVADINGDAKPDLLITAKGAQTAYINDGGAFRAMKPEERTAIEKALAGLANTAPTTATK